MESLDPTLYSVLQSLYENNGRKSWNMYPENNGSICLKIRFNGRGVGSSEENIRHKSASKVKRNFNRAKNYKDIVTENSDSRPAKRNRSDLSPDMYQSIEIEKPRNCTEPYVDHQAFTLDHNLSPVGCAPNITDQSPLVNCAEITTPLGNLETCDESDTESFKECPSQDIEIELDSQEQIIEIPKPLDPYDNDNDSVYDENVFPDWRHIDRPCIQAGCFYRPNQTIEDSELNSQLGHRPNGTFCSYYKCNTCGRILCNECVYFKMRHLNHFKHIKEIYQDGEPVPIPIEQIIEGLI